MKHSHLIALVAFLLLAVGLASCAGLDLGDFVRVRTPQAVQQDRGLPATITLNEAEEEYRSWLDETKRTGTRWKASIQKAGEVRGLLGQLTLSAFDSLGPTVAGLPILGPALPALTGILGLVLGTGRLRKHKEASFNKGLEKGQAA